MPRTTCRKFSISVRSPTTSVVEIDTLCEGGSLLAADPDCESKLNDVATDPDDASGCVLVRVAWRHAFKFVGSRPGDRDPDTMAVLLYTPILSAPIPVKPAVVSGATGT